MSEQGSIAVIGAGIIGSAIAMNLAREGKQVVLIDRAEPGVAGASFGNAGHIACEDIQPLPSPALLFGFYREQFSRGGTLDLSLRQVTHMLPWIRRFAVAAFRRAPNTRYFEPLVRPSVDKWAYWLDQIGRPELLRRRGHYEIEFGPHAAGFMRGHSGELRKLGINTRPLTDEQLLPFKNAANQSQAAGVWFEDSAHVLDPLQAVRAFTAAALARQAKVLRMEVTALRPRGDRIEILSEQPCLEVKAAVVCAGIQSPPLLAPFGINAPLQAVRGYHVELPGQAAFADVPVVYSSQRMIVTPMAGRLRATSYMEFKPPTAPADPRKPARLRQKLRAVGYACEPEGLSWLGARPVLPDYLPGIGRVPGAPNVYYAIGHQHLGLTLAPMTGELVADLVAERPPRIPIQAFDLRRFGSRVP
jgi:D-hydroxyproline dehydrogenase